MSIFVHKFLRGDYVYSVALQKVENRLQIMSDLRELASAESPDSFTLIYTNILEHHPDCPVSVMCQLLLVVNTLVQLCQLLLVVNTLSRKCYECICSLIQFDATNPHSVIKNMLTIILLKQRTNLIIYRQ